MPQDIWEMLNESLGEIRKELSLLSDKYAEGIKQIWIKLTELEVTLKTKADMSRSAKDDFKWLVPTILAILSLAIAYLYKR